MAEVSLPLAAALIYILAQAIREIGRSLLNILLDPPKYSAKYREIFY